MNELQYYLQNHYSASNPALFIAENFEFNAKDFTDLAGLSILFKEVAYLENQDVVHFNFHIGNKESNQSILELTFFVCLHGSKTAFGVFFDDLAANSRAILSFESETAASGIGEIALLWAHSGVLDALQLGFLRHNLYVSIKAHQEKSSAFIVQFARELDEKIYSLATTEVLDSKKSALFSIWDEKKYQIPEVQATEILELGNLLTDKACFFSTESGSVNRKFDEKDFWYYRSGLQKGRQKMTVIELGKGILPEKSEFFIDVI